VNDDLRLSVVDTSSLIQVRRTGLSAPRQVAIFTRLTALVDAGRLVFPPQVRAELEWGEADHPDDEARAWVRRVRDRAEREANLETVRQILASAPTLIDPQSSRDQADPYVIALAVDADNIGGVRIVTEDRRDHVDGRGTVARLSLATAAGMWNIPVVPLAGFMMAL
jgi:hypothetical protein